MTDRRIPLPAGGVLIGENGESYTIRPGAVGRGGCSLVYPASKQGSRRLFVIKECYPLTEEAKFVRRGWDLAPADGDDAAAWALLDGQRRALERENALGQELAGRSGRLIASWELFRPLRFLSGGRSWELPGEGFAVMEQAEGAGHRGWFLRELLAECAKPMKAGRPLRRGGAPGAELSLRIMEELLKSLRDIHRAGCIHGDVQDGNIFFMGPDPETGDIGVGQLFDFGSARRLAGDGLTEPVSDRRIFCAPGYAAPEIRRRNDGTLRLSAAADVYSAGCLLLYLLRGMALRDCLGAELELADGLAPPLTRRRAERLGFHGEAAGRVVELLARALADEPEERYADAGEMLSDVLRLRQLLRPARHRLPENLCQSPYYVPGSRDGQLARLEEQFNAGSSPVWLWGVWGIGKTELAVEFARRQLRLGRSAHLIRYRGSMRETILGLEFSGYSFRHDGRSEPRSQEYREKLELLLECCGDGLLVIDNFEREGTELEELMAEPACRELFGSGLKLLITTRTRPDRLTPELPPLGEADALALYTSITGVDEAGRAEALELIRRLRCHPLAVELAARAVEYDWGEGRVSARSLLAALRSGRAEGLDVPVDGGGAGAYARLRSLFNVLDLGGEYRGVLCRSCLLPEEGMDAGLWLSAEAEPDRRRLRQLEAHGWLRRGRDNRLVIHPLVRSVLKNELRPREGDCEGFLAAMWKRLEAIFPKEGGPFPAAAELFSRAALELGDSRGEQGCRAARCCLAAGRPAQALGLAGESLEIRRAAGTAEEQAEALCICALALRDMGGYEQALDAALEAWGLLSEQPACKGRLRLCSLISGLYGQLGRPGEACEYGRRALELLAALPPADTRAEAEVEARAAMGFALADAGDFAAAAVQLEAAAGLGEELYPPGHQELAGLLASTASVLARAGERGRALELARRALGMQEAALPADHEDISAVLRLLSELHEAAGETQEALACAERARAADESRARALWSKRLAFCVGSLGGPEAAAPGRERARLLRGAAEACARLGRPEEAGEYIERALKLLSACGSAEAALCLMEASDISAAAKEPAAARERAGRALGLLRAASPRDHGAMAVCAMKLGNICRDMGRSGEAARWYRQAADCEKRLPYPDAGFIQLAEGLARSLRGGRDEK